MPRKKGVTYFVKDRVQKSVIKNHRAPTIPHPVTFPTNGYDFQRRLHRERIKEQLLKNTDMIVRYERRKRMKMLLADLGPTYLENLRIECTPYLKAA